MDLRFTPEEERFRQDVRDFLSESLPEGLSRKVADGKRLARADYAFWHDVLNRRGWLASHWPVAHGGTGWTTAQRFIFDVETALAHAPPIVPFGLSMLGPVLIAFGTEAQRRHWLPRILDGSDWWCQGYSEPGAGSDLASLKTSAVRDGDVYVVNGQKTWTTLGQYANMIFCLVRTSTEGKKQQGISFLLIDMTSPGVEVRPITLLDGEREVNEIFFTDVRVPAENLVGEENGFGGGAFDIAVVFELLGGALVVEPFLGTLMAGRVLSHIADQGGLLDTVIAGEAALAIAHEEPQGRHAFAAIATWAACKGDTWALTGMKAVVAQAEAADHIVVSARTSDAPDQTTGIGLFLVERGAPGLIVRGYPLIDGGRGGDILLSETPALRLAGEGSALVDDAVAAGLVALVWEAVGLMDVLKASTIDYLRTRTQFGMPIGKFQALQHRMATVVLEIEQARSSAINAAAALDGDAPARDRAVSAAKYTIGRVGTLVAEEAIQMHGGIGMTWELPVSHYAKRLTMIGHQLGDEDVNLARYAALGRPA